MEQENRLRLLLKKKQTELKKKKIKAPIEIFFHQIRHYEFDILNYLKNASGPCLITELNPLPSLEEIKENEDILRQINQSKAVAIITEPSFNAGMGNLHTAGKIFRIPVLHVDYHIEPYQIYESRFLNAGMIILSVGLLSMVDVAELFLLSRELGMETILNITNRKELDLAFNTATNFFSIDRENYFGQSLTTTEIIDLVQYIPKDKFAVCRMTKIDYSELMTLIEAEIDLFILPLPTNAEEKTIIQQLFCEK